MNIQAVKNELLESGMLDQRKLLSYATLTATLQGVSFQNIVAVCFRQEDLSICQANLDNTLGLSLKTCPYRELMEFELRHRLLYSYTSFVHGEDHFRFYSYDKKVFLQGFRDSGLIE